MMGRWAVIGAAGFVARRHIEAIRHHGGEVVAAVDPSDVAGHLDSLAPGCRYFRDIAPFIAWETHSDDLLDGVAICSPNDMHAGHGLCALPFARSIVVEKPAALSVEDVLLMDREAFVIGRTVHPVLQMRLHPEAKRLVEFARAPRPRPHVTLVYGAPRGDWYAGSWKGDDRRSGGLAFNLSIHALDLLALAFGRIVPDSVDEARAGDGCLNAEFALERADVSIAVASKCQIPVRSIVVMDGFQKVGSFDLSDGIDLHREWYGELLAGRAPTLDDARAGIEIAEAIRGAL